MSCCDLQLAATPTRRIGVLMRRVTRNIVCSVGLSPKCQEAAGNLYRPARPPLSRRIPAGPWAVHCRSTAARPSFPRTEQTRLPPRAGRPGRGGTPRSRSSRTRGAGAARPPECPTTRSSASCAARSAPARRATWTPLRACCPLVRGTGGDIDPFCLSIPRNPLTVRLVQTMATRMRTGGGGSATVSPLRARPHDVVHDLGGKGGPRQIVRASPKPSVTPYDLPSYVTAPANMYVGWSGKRQAAQDRWRMTLTRPSHEPPDKGRGVSTVLFFSCLFFFSF